MARAWGLLLAIGVRLRAGDTCVPHGRGRARSGLVGGVLAGWQRGPGPLRSTGARPGDPSLGVRSLAQLCGDAGLGCPQPKQDPLSGACTCVSGVEAAFHLRSRNTCSWVGPHGEWERDGLGGVATSKSSAPTVTPAPSPATFEQCGALDL